ncbi:hypothetical protein PFISCL1PPCAC_12226, partial [Pristionchus fissidentatus]
KDWNMHLTNMKTLYSSSEDCFETWRRSAANFAKQDRIGNLIARMSELMQKVGAIPENSDYLLMSLDMERQLAIDHDEQRHLPLRDLVFSFCTGLKSTIESIIEDKKRREVEQTNELVDTDQNANTDVDSSDDEDPDEINSENDSMDGSERRSEDVSSPGASEK